MPLRALLIAVLFLVGCTSAPPELVPTERDVPVGTTRVEMRLVRNLPLVPVHIADEGPFWFVLDTGAEATVIDRRVVEELDLTRRDRGIEILGADGGTTSAAGLARLQQLRFGDVTFSDWDACVLDLSHLRLKLGAPLDGILGYGTFEGCRLVMDYPGRQVVVSRGPRLDPKARDVVPCGAGRLPRVSVAIGEEVVGLVIDSGSAETLALPSVREAAFRFEHGPVAGHRATTIGGPARRNVLGRLRDDVHLAGHVVARPLVFLTEGPGRIGGAVLRHFRVTFDVPSQLVRLARHENGPVVTGSFRSPGFSIARTEDGWVIADVVPDTAAAAAGLQPGDRLAFVNGIAGSDLSERRWRRICANDDVLSLVLLRGSTKIELLVRVTDVVP